MAAKDSLVFSSGRYLILEKNAVVASDLLEAIREVDPEAEVFVCGTYRSAEDHVAMTPGLDVAFIHVRRDDPEPDALIRGLRGHAAQVVLIENADVRFGKTALLNLPFVTESVAAALNGLVVDGPQPAG
ncbi:hypothetical protein [Tranquillimonas alkanivorans]|uniref:Response regulatory domain-containing protein n=1 Tax=Tranquillimonas alkanivorans TaxID=441119 RepID=A0A1I5PDC9_9RHOB|nr:hypothetical protein [Tranquillimonas alkanivorans]SFP32102.1 hypothetical protein SAMN04488047_10551 [Tranquillimonas alkanivorans]